MNFSKFFSVVKNFVSNINKVAKKPFESEVNKILDELRKRSPVDTGAYQESWKTRKGPSGKKDSTVIFYNDDPKFALMEFGAEPGEAPWYFPHTLKAPSGKLKESGGKIWAGGLNPGHQLTVGGALSSVINDYEKLNKWQGLSEAILKVV